MITEAENGEIKAPRVWRSQEAVQPGANPDRSRGVRQASRETICEPLTANRDDWTRGNFTEQCGQAILGGIIDRLISKTLDLIKESESRTAELKIHLEDLRELYNQFQNKTEESQ